MGGRGVRADRRGHRARQRPAGWPQEGLRGLRQGRNGHREPDQHADDPQEHERQGRKDDMDNNAAEVAAAEDAGEAAAGKFTFAQFCQVAAKFMIEDDEGQMKEELKEAFRIYDREGQGFITTDVLKEILREIDTTLTEEDLDNIIEEVDDDASGTLDFDEFVEMMMG